MKRVDAIPVLHSSGKRNSAFETRLLVCLHNCLRDIPQLLRLNTVVATRYNKCDYFTLITEPLLYVTLKVARIENPVFSLDK